MTFFSKIFRSTSTTNKPILHSEHQSHVIEFTLWKEDLPLEVQLEPECYIFKVEPGNTLRFVASADENEFKWSVIIESKSGGIQLFPEGDGDIRVYENDELLKDWFKYMR